MISRTKIIFFIILCLILWQILSFLHQNTIPLPHTSKNYTLPEQPVLVGVEVQEKEKSKPITPALKVEVFYETLCPDSRSFFIRQLLPAYLKMPELIKLILVPYGKATTSREISGQYIFRCQHGPIECLGNKVHACAIHFIKNPTQLLHYLTCMINDNSNPDDVGFKCARTLNIEWADILTCAQSSESDQLLADHGELTHSLQPPASFIPTIRVNDKLDRQPALLKNLFKELCTRFEERPVVCPK